MAVCIYEAKICLAKVASRRDWLVNSPAGIEEFCFDFRPVDFTHALGPQ